MRTAILMGMAVICACGSTDALHPVDSVGNPSSDGGSPSSNGTPDGGAVQRRALAIHVVGSGDVQGGAVDCPSDCTEQLGDGEAVHLVATADAGFRFDGWQGDCSGSGACDLTMSTDHTVTVTFTKLVTITVSMTGNGSGRVISSPSGIDCPGSCSMTMPGGTSLTLTAAAGVGSTFVGWGSACTGAGVCTVAAGTDETVWANFALLPPPVDSCAGIAPPDKPAMGQYVQNPWYQLGFACGNATADSSGDLALVVSGGHGDVVAVVDPSGKVLNGVFTSLFGFVVPQPRGFTEVSGRPYLGPSWAIQFGQMISDLDSAGTLTGQNYFANHSGQTNLPSAAGPNGGVLLAGDLAMDPTVPAIHAAVMYDGGGTKAALRWGPAILASTGAVFGVGVDVLDRSLVITDGAANFGSGTISAQWLDKDGTPLTGEFVLLRSFSAGAATWFDTTPLIGGGLLVRRRDGDSHAQALVVVNSGTPTVAAAPAWMVARPDVKMQIARGGKAYAVLPLAATGVPCTQRVEVVAPDGTSCGAADYAIASGTCDTLEMWLGTDGTVIQQLPTAMEQTNDTVGGHTCTWRWWSGAVR